MQIPSSHRYRSLAVALLLCFLWLVALALGLFGRLPWPMEVKVLIGLGVSLAIPTLVLYPTVLFRELGRTRRFVNLVGVSIALVTCSASLLFAASFLLFALGAIEPN